MKPLPQKRRGRLAIATVIAVLMSACSTTVGGEAATRSIAPPDTVANPGQTVPPTTEGPTGDGDTTTTTEPDVPYTPTPVPVEEPPFEEVTITTDDGLDLYAKYWKGSSTAVLYTHHIQTQLSGPQDSTSIQPFNLGVIEAGYTVLTPEFRGHGNSPGTAFANDSKADIKAAYEFLVDAGHDPIIAIAVRGSGPVLVNVHLEDPEVTFDGIGLPFPPLSRSGNDLLTDLPQVEEPVWITHIDAGSSGGIPNRLGAVTGNLYDAYLFPRTPSGLQFVDVYGEEYMGRILAFLEFVEAGA